MGLNDFFNNFACGLGFGMIAGLPSLLYGRGCGGFCGSFPMMGGFGNQSSQFDYMFDNSFENSFPKIDYSGFAASLWDYARQSVSDYFSNMPKNTDSFVNSSSGCNQCVPQYTMPFSGYYFTNLQSPYLTNLPMTFTGTVQQQPAAQPQQQSPAQQQPSPVQQPSAQSLEPDATDADAAAERPTPTQPTNPRPAVTNVVTPPVSNSELARLRGRHWSELTDEQMRQVYGNYATDITEPYTGTVEKLNKYLRGKGVLEGKAEVFMNAQRTYGINAAVLAAITVHESGMGKSRLAKRQNNVGGVRKPGSSEFRTFNSVDECIMEMARFLKSGYVNNSGRPLTKLYQINAKYCPTSDPTDTTNGNSGWARAVAGYISAIEGMA